LTITRCLFPTGTLRFKVVFTKRRFEWVTKKIFAKKTFNFHHVLMERLLRRRQDVNVVLGESTMDMEMPDMPSNIGSRHAQKPLKEDAIKAHKSRFAMSQ